MKAMLLAAAFAVGSSGYAIAADATVEAVEIVDSSYDWSGFYAGVQAGGSWANLDQRIPGYEPFTNTDGDMSGWLLGGYAGFNMQSGNFVYGGEIGANWRDVDGSNDSFIGDTEQLVTEQKWDASLVGKAGMAFDTLLVYGLAGAAVTEVESHYSDGGASGPTASDTVWGWTIGAGVEKAFTPNVRGRLEYRFADYDEADVTCSECGPTFVEPQTHSIAAGIAYNW